MFSVFLCVCWSAICMWKSLLELRQNNFCINKYVFFSIIIFYKYWHLYTCLVYVLCHLFSLFNFYMHSSYNFFILLKPNTYLILTIYSLIYYGYIKINNWTWLSSRGQWCFGAHVQKPVKSSVTHCTAIHIALPVCRLLVLQVCSILYACVCVCVCVTSTN